MNTLLFYIEITDLSFDTIRNWVAFIILIIGGIIAIRTYALNQRQRRLENSFRLLDLFDKSIGEVDIKNWINMFYNTSVAAGVKPGFYINSETGGEQPLSDLFDLAAPDDGTTQKMAEFFDLISEKALENTIDLKVIYFKLGQLMDYTHNWIALIDKERESFKLLEEDYPNFAKLYKKYGHTFKEWNNRTYTQLC